MVVSIKDTQGVIARDAPLLIWTDNLRLGWSTEEKELLEEDEELQNFLEEIPPAYTPARKAASIAKYSWDYGIINLR
jgi:hypothetical protein